MGSCSPLRASLCENAGGHNGQRSQRPVPSPGLPREGQACLPLAILSSPGVGGLACVPRDQARASGAAAGAWASGRDCGHLCCNSARAHTHTHTLSPSGIMELNPQSLSRASAAQPRLPAHTQARLGLHTARSVFCRGLCLPHEVGAWASDGNLRPHHGPWAHASKCYMHAFGAGPCALGL